MRAGFRPSEHRTDDPPDHGGTSMNETHEHSPGNAQLQQASASILAAAKQQRLRGILLGAVVVLAMIGVVNGWYLTMVHVDYELSPDSALRKVCGALATHGCAVTSGRFGDVAGIPVSVIGLGGAAATAVTAAIARRRRSRIRDPWRSTVLALAIISVLASLLMGSLSLVEGSFCPFCVAWYGLNLTMGICAFVSWRLGRKTSWGRLVRDPVGRPGAAAAAVFAVGLGAGSWGYHDRRDAVLDDLAEAVLERVLVDERPVELDLEGLPSRGPADATLTVVELADFSCPYCRALWEGIEEYTEHSSFSVRVVFMHFPLDDSCNGGVEGLHPQACAAARAAECARRHDAFFEYGDLLFEHQPAFAPEQLVGYARELGLPEDEFRACLDDAEAEREVRRGIERARRSGLETTPTFFVNGYRFRGARDPRWLELVLDGLARIHETTAADPR